MSNEARVQAFLGTILGAATIVVAGILEITSLGTEYRDFAGVVAEGFRWIGGICAASLYVNALITANGGRR